MKSYPRWSASLWDLSARAIALAGSQDPDKPQERLPPLEEVEKRFAQATAVSAVIVHKDATGYSTRQLASMAIVRYPRANGVYRATLIEDMLPALSTVPFVFRPKYLRPAELVARAALVALTGGLRELPPRPALRLPTTQVIEGVPHIVLQRMAEPARTGFRRWLHRENLPIVGELDGIPGGVTPETLYARFLREAV